MDSNTWNFLRVVKGKYGLMKLSMVRSPGEKMGKHYILMKELRTSRLLRLMNCRRQH